MNMPPQCAIDVDLVKREALGHATDDEANFLRQPENLDAWREALVSMTQSVQVEAMRARARIEESRARRADYEAAMKEHAQWSARAGNFRQAVEARLRECKRLQVERDKEIAGDLRRDMLSRIGDLEAEVADIRRHLAGVRR